VVVPEGQVYKKIGNRQPATAGYYVLKTYSWVKTIGSGSGNYSRKRRTGKLLAGNVVQGDMGIGHSFVIKVVDV